MVITEEAGAAGAEPLPPGHTVPPGVGRGLLVLLTLLAAVGAICLVEAMRMRGWLVADEHAYWLAGRAILEGRSPYDPTATPVTPFTYLYPPPFALAMVPFAALVPAGAFSFLWTVGQAIALWWLLGARRDAQGLLVLVASLAFLPIPIELLSGNVHLFLAVVMVLALRGAPWLFGLAAVVKISPGVGIAYLASAGRWRDALVATALAAVVVLASVVLVPVAWGDFLRFVLREGGSSGASLVPVAYPVRLVAAVILAIVAGRLRPAIGEPLLVIAVVAGSPSLYATTLSMLVAIVGLRTHPAAPTTMQDARLSEVRSAG